jgi:hypothetical protein
MMGLQNRLQAEGKPRDAVKDETDSAAPLQ